MPSRVIRAEINSSESLNRVSLEAELLFFKLITVVDDFGRCDARMSMIKAACFPLRDVNLGAMSIWLEELESADCLVLYEVECRLYL